MTTPVNPNDNAVLQIGDGNFFKAPTGTAIPADLTAIPGIWGNVGHTSLDDLFAAATEGGDATTLATLQNRTLRTKYAAKVTTFSIKLQQFDTESLKLHYGSNAEIVAGDLVGVPEKPAPTTCAFLAVFLDEENVFALYVPKAEILGNEDPDFGDDEKLASLPIGVKALRFGTNKWTYAVTPLGDA